MLLGKMTCNNCGTEIESIPMHCGENMNYNKEEERWECYMGPDCGYVDLDDILCAKCAETKC